MAASTAQLVNVLVILTFSFASRVLCLRSDRTSIFASAMSKIRPHAVLSAARDQKEFSPSRAGSPPTFVNQTDLSAVFWRTTCHIQTLSKSLARSDLKLLGNCKRGTKLPWMSCLKTSLQQSPPTRAQQRPLWLLACSPDS